MVQRKKISFEHKKSLTVEIIFNKMPQPKFGSWVVEAMSKLSRFIYIKSHITLHVKCNAENVNFIAFLMVFDRSKQILNSFLASLIVMSLH